MRIDQLLIKGFGAPRYSVVCAVTAWPIPESPLASGIHAEIIFRTPFWYPITLKSLAVITFASKTPYFSKVGAFEAGYSRPAGKK